MMTDREVARHPSPPRERLRTPELRIELVQVGSRWWLLLNGQRMGRFGQKEDAVRCAFDIAEETRCDGLQAEILVEGVFQEATPVG